MARSERRRQGGGAAAQLVYTVLVTVVARLENAREARFFFPLIPRLIASMSLLDGAVLAWAVHPAWLLAGVVAATLTIAGQRFVRGDQGRLDQPAWSAGVATRERRRQPSRSRPRLPSISEAMPSGSITGSGSRSGATKPRLAFTEKSAPME